MKKSLISTNEIKLFVLMLITYAATIYFIVTRAYFLILLLFVINSCLNIVCLYNIFKNYNLISKEDALRDYEQYTNKNNTHKKGAHKEALDTEKQSLINQASRTIAHLQTVNTKLMEENRELKQRLNLPL